MIKTNNRVIITDIDQVVLNHTKPFGEFLQNRKQVELPVPLEEMSGPYSETLMPHIKKAWGESFDMEDFERWVFEFNTSEEFCRLPFIEDAMTSLNILRSLGFVIIGATACGRHMDTRILRNMQLSKTFNDVHYVDYHEGKDAIFQQFAGSNYFYIDDKPTHVMNADRYGLNAHLMLDPQYSHLEHNVPENKQFDNWGAILKRILEIHT